LSSTTKYATGAYTFLNPILDKSDNICEVICRIIVREDKSEAVLIEKPVLPVDRFLIFKNQPGSKHHRRRSDTNYHMSCP
jgi:hypothetical protein